MNTKTKHPEMLKELDEFIKEFKDESDRAAVILGVAKLDSQLSHLLKKTLVQTTNKDDELFDGEAPLSTLSAKIYLAYRLGYIDARFARALHLVRRIRNAFAHESRNCTLSSGPESGRIRDLKLTFSETDFFNLAKAKYFSRSYDIPSADFRTALVLLEMRMQAVVTYAKPIPDDKAFPLIVPGWKKKPFSKVSDKK